MSQSTSERLRRWSPWKIAGYTAAGVGVAFSAYKLYQYYVSSQDASTSTKPLPPLPSPSSVLHTAAHASSPESRPTTSDASTDMIFQAAVQYLNTTNVKTGVPEKLRFYSLFKQATHALSCRDAWKQLGALPREDAMSLYIATLDTLAPQWRLQLNEFLPRGETKGTHHTGEKKEQKYETLASGSLHTKSKPISQESKEAKEKEQDIDALLDSDAPPPKVSSASMSFAVSVSRPQQEPEPEVAESDKSIWDHANEGHTAQVERLLNSGYDINEQDQDGRSVLMMAVDREHIELVRLLLTKYKPNVNLQDADGQTALHYACICESKPCVELLLAHGARVDIKNSEGETPLDLSRASHVNPPLIVTPPPKSVKSSAQEATTPSPTATASTPSSSAPATNSAQTPVPASPAAQETAKPFIASAKHSEPTPSSTQSVQSLPETTPVSSTLPPVAASLPPTVSPRPVASPTASSHGDAVPSASVRSAEPPVKEVSKSSSNEERKELGTTTTKPNGLHPPVNGSAPSEGESPNGSQASSEGQRSPDSADSGENGHENGHENGGSNGSQKGKPMQPHTHRGGAARNKHHRKKKHKQAAKKA